MPQNSVNAILQDSRGYIWLGTQEGLVRFDGIQFFVFDKKHFNAMTSNYVWTIAEGPDGSLWFGTQGGGLCRIKENQCTAFTTKDGLPSNHVTALQFDKSDRLWIGTNRGLALYADSTFQVFTKENGLADDEVGTLLSDSQGSLWIGTNGGGLNRFREGRFERFHLQEGLLDGTVFSLLELNDGAMLVGTNGGISIIRNGKVAAYRSGGREIKSQPFSMVQDSLGAIWIGTAGDGLLRIWDGGQEYFGVEEGLSDGFVRSLFQDREGNLWAGTFGGGVNFFADGKFTRFTRSEGLSHDFTLTVCEDEGGTLWVGTYGGGLNRLREGKAVHISTAHGLPSNIVSSVLPDRRGAIWVGSYGEGLSWMDAGKIVTFTIRQGLSSNFITSLLQGKNGALWVGTTNGLNVRSGETFRPLKLTGDYNQPAIIALRESREGGLWIGTEGRGLAHHRDGKVTFFTTDHGLPVDYVTALYEDAHGALWIGTDGGGLVRYASGQFAVINSKGGLFDDVVFSILEDGYGFLWMSCNKGIFRVSKEELNAFANGTIDRVQSIAYNRYDGMPSSECVGRRQPAAWKARDGTLWFPTIKGVVSIDPGHIKVNTQIPPVVVEAVIAGANTVYPGASMILSPGINHFEIRYAA
ncbi:MAG: two-component regulator propeller domain-containing protein, partial [Bacteroidota bacterium]